MMLSALIRNCGEDSVTFQQLQRAMVGAHQLKSGVCRISFETDAVTCDEIVRGTSPLLGIVVWLPRDKVQQAQASTGRPARKARKAMA